MSACATNCLSFRSSLLRLGGVLGAAVLLACSFGAGAQQQAPTDIGPVTTGPGTEPGAAAPVAPSSTGTRAQAIEQKKEAPNIIEVQPLSEIRKLPDINTAEALQRMPGISLETDTGEGRFINIRGLDSDLNGTTYGGVRLLPSNAASPFSGGRAVAFDTIPTGMIAGIELTKTSRPDLDADALGGTINLVPRSPSTFTGKHFIEGNFAGGFEPLRDTPVYHAEGSVGHRFGGGDGIGGWFAGNDAFAAMLTGVYHDDQRGVDDVEESYSDNQSSGVPDKVLSQLNLRRYTYHRKRYGLGGELDARGDEFNKFYFRFLLSGYTELKVSQQVLLGGMDSGYPCGAGTCYQDPNNPAGYLASAGQSDMVLSNPYERVQNNLAVLGGSSVFGGAKFDYRVSYVEGVDKFPWSFGSDFSNINNGNIPLAYDNNTDPRYPKFHATNGLNLIDPQAYVLDNPSTSSIAADNSGINNGPSNDHDREWSGAVDGTLPVDWLNRDGELKFGVNIHSRHKNHDDASGNFNPAAGYPGAGYIPYTFAAHGAPVIYYDQHYDIGPQINPYTIQALYAKNAVNAPAPTDGFDDEENVYATYGEYIANFGRFGVLAGMRFEWTQGTYRGYIVNTASGGGTTSTYNSQGADYFDYFPTVQGRFSIRPDLIARVTYSSAIGRPGFDQVTATRTIDQTASPVGVTIGNPNLRPTTGDNFDGTLEWYPGDSETASIGVFDKEFSNYILPSSAVVATFPGVSIPGPIRITEYSNGPARAYGAEAAFEKRFRFLPEPLDGLGLSGNITLVHSDAEIHPGQHGLLPSTARVTWNTEVFYEKGPAELRVAVDYVGQNLFSFGNTQALDTFSRHRLTMDLGSSYAIMRKLVVYFDAKNLFNTPLEFTEGPSEQRPIQREFYDITLFGGVRFEI